jgi:hypothetical protein
MALHQHALLALLSCGRIVSKTITDVRLDSIDRSGKQITHTCKSCSNKLQHEAHGSSAQGFPALCLRPRLLFTHHKAGTIMAEQAAMAIDAKLRMLCAHRAACLPRSVDCWEVNCTTQSLEHAGVLIKDEAEATCAAHIVRDPFELVVSGYLYNRNQRKYSGVADNAGDAHEPAENYASLLEQRMLPPAIPSESYSSYLRRVSARDGILAETQVATAFTFPQMLQLFQQVEKGTCAINSCALPRITNRALNATASQIAVVPQTILLVCGTLICVQFA